MFYIGKKKYKLIVCIDTITHYVQQKNEKNKLHKVVGLTKLHVVVYLMVSQEHAASGFTQSIL